MRRHLLPAFLPVLLLSAAPLYSQSKAKAIDRLVKSYAAERQFNGAVLVAERGKVIYSQGIGLANAEWNIPATPTTRFRLASVSKQFTAMVILQLAEEGKLDLDEKVAAYLPGWPKPQGEIITIHHLLTHTSGLPNQSGDTNIERQLRMTTTPEHLLARFWALPLDFQPGAKFEYSNTGYVALGLIIEKLTGMSYERAIRTRIFEPLGMKNSGYESTTAFIPERATGYTKLLNGYQPAPFLEMSQVYAAGALYSTVEDLYLWDRALYTDKLLSDRYRAMMLTPMVTSSFGGGYGYGFAINRAAIGPKGDSVTLVAHSGGLIGFSALLTRMIDREHLIVLLDNRNPGSAPLERITRGIANILYDGEPAPPVRSIASHLYTVIREKGIDAAVERYRELKTSKAREYNLAEGELNILGYEMLKEGRTKEAIEIFKLNVESYPNGPNTYDSLGEAYMIAGDRDRALENYARSLRMNPANTNAATMLKRLAGN